MIPINHRTLFAAALVSLVFSLTSWGQGRGNAAAVSPDYKISPGDIIMLNTLDDPQGKGSFRVSQEGRIPHAYLEAGSFKVAGLTANQAARALENTLRGDYLVNPRVTITVLSYAKITFSVLGAVNNAGPYEANANKKLTIVHAIARAGDFNDVANRKKVIVRRIKSGKKRSFTVNVKALLDNPNLPPFFIQDGDTIEVKERLF